MNYKTQGKNNRVRNKKPVIVDECHNYGIVNGCDVNCPVLIKGNCELKDTDNKDLYDKVKGNCS